jgi:hypothetical protein
LDIFAKIWEWDRFEEREQLKALFALCDEFVLLAMSAENQARLTPDPSEVRTTIWLAKNRIERCCMESLPQELFARLAQIKYVLDEMPEDACNWSNPSAFEEKSWSEIRDLAKQALVLLEWETIASSKDHLQAFK